MSERWTKGPWELGFEAEGDSDSDDSGRSVGWYTGGEVFSGEIVTARDENGEQEVVADYVRKRDAHLIAAAPEMYEALKKTCSNALDLGLCTESSCATCQNMAALKKARGES